MTVAEDLATAAETTSPHELAVKVEGVTKTYGLWSSPGARLQYALLNVMRRLVPGGTALGRRLTDRTHQLYHEFKALDEISFEVRKGESWGFIGVNGSGKSTLLKMISGNLRPSSGRIEVDGKVALLDYSSGLHPEFTGRENIFLKAAVMGMSRKETEAKLTSIIEFADIGEFIEQPVKTYSSGMQARLGFAIVAHVDADIIITDEALAVGDAFFVQKCMDFIRTFLKRGTFLFVSHSTNDVVSLCEKAIWLDRGHVRSIGAAKDVTDAYLAHQAMGQSARFLSRNKRAATQKVDAAQPEVANTAAGQGHEIAQPELGALQNAKPARVIKDMRLDYPNNPKARNDIEVAALDVSSGFGVGGAKVTNVSFEDINGSTLSHIVGAELVRLRVEVLAEEHQHSPIVGFQFKDRLGQTLFADNTYLVTLNEPLDVPAGRQFDAEFEFQMPMLPVGEYAIRIGIVSGSESDGAMLHAIDAALIVRSVTSGSRHGIVGVPMQRISLSMPDEP